METAELIGIDEDGLRRFLIALPKLWNSRKKWYESGIEPMLSNFIDCERKLTSTHLFKISSGIIIVFTEYLKDVEAAAFEFHAWFLADGSCQASEPTESRLREIIVNYTEEDAASFRENTAFFGEDPVTDIFICPMCKAQYSFRSLRISEEGLTQCQNCGKSVHVVRHESPLDTNMTVVDDESTN